MSSNYTFDPELGVFVYTVPAISDDEAPFTDAQATQTLEATQSTIDDEIREVSEEDFFFDIVPGGTAPEALHPPETFYVGSQTVRTNPDGSTVVDVVIQIDDGSDSAEYEVRVTK